MFLVRVAQKTIGILSERKDPFESPRFIGCDAVLVCQLGDIEGAGDTALSSSMETYNCAGLV